MIGAVNATPARPDRVRRRPARRRLPSAPVAESRVLHPGRTYLRLLPPLVAVDAVVVLLALAMTTAATVTAALLVPPALHVTAWLVVARRRNAAGPGWAATFTG